MENDWKKRLGVVYSTSEEFDYEYNEEDTQETLPPEKQHLTISRDRKQRKGKTVTLISGFTGSGEDLDDLGKLLKKKCGVGGSVKDGEIILQGDHRQKVEKILDEMSYRTKLSGG